MPEDPGHAGRPTNDVELQNAIISHLAEIQRYGVTISPGASPAGALYNALGVKSRNPAYSLEEFEALLESMVKRRLIHSEMFYRSSRPLLV